ncbi:unnamed protein product [Linum tenue]|uniref:DNA-directed RNA polymerase n=1 Tax=Linum tenue TaxID=586396 RepID=A0AAV0IDZ3_9ROSI|nr:unnamed protein product [Linum tenue]
MLKEDGSAPSSGSFQSLMASVLRQKSLPDSWHLGNPQLLLNQIQLFVNPLVFADSYVEATLSQNILIDPSIYIKEDKNLGYHCPLVYQIQL